MNKILLIGNCTAKPELRTTQDGTNIATFTIAVNSRKQNEQAQFFRISAWRALGENCAKYLDKGSKVYVEGDIRINTYTGRDGKDHFSAEVTASQCEFLSPKNAQNAPAETSQYVPPVPEPQSYTPVETDDLPF